MTTRGILAGWHNVSTNGTLNVDGVSVQDIISILNTIKSDPRFINWREVLDYMYEHVVDKENPHHVTTDQLATTVIQVIYESWLLEGYSGNLQYFIDLLYRYIEFADDAIMNEEVSEVHVPTIDVLTRYIEKHNTDLNAHADLINPYFIGNCDIVDPAQSFRQLVGMTEEETIHLNLENTHYEKIPIHDGWAAKEMTFVLGFKFEEAAVLQFENANGTVVLRVDSQPAQQRILFTRCVSNNLNVAIDSSITENLASIPNTTVDYVAIPHNRPFAKCAIVLDGARVKYCLFQRSLDVLMNTNPQVIEFDLNGTPTFVSLNTNPSPFKNPRLSFSKMDKGDILTDLIYYPQALTIDQLLYVYEWIDCNIREGINDNYGPPVIVDISVDPPAPTSKPTVFLLSGTNGLLNARSNDGLVAVNETDNLVIDIVSAIKNDQYILVVNSSGELFIKRNETEDFVSSGRVQFNSENITVHGMYLFEKSIFFTGKTLADSSCVVMCSADLLEENFTVALECTEEIHDMAYGVLPGWAGPVPTVIVACDDRRIYYLALSSLQDGNFFDSVTINEGPSGDWDIHCVTFGNNSFVFGGSNGTIGVWDEEYLEDCPDPIQVGLDTTTWKHIVFQDPFFVVFSEDGQIAKTIMPVRPEDEYADYYPIQWGSVTTLTESVNIVDAISDHDVCVAVDSLGKMLISKTGDVLDATINVSSTETLSGIYSRPLDEKRKNFAFITEQGKVGVTNQLVDVELVNARTQQDWDFLCPGNGSNWVAASRYGKLAYTLDLNDWHESDNFFPGWCKFCKFVDGQFLYFNDQGNLYTSSTGQTWTLLAHIDDYQEDPWAYYITAFATNGTDKHIIVYKNHVFYSSDLVTWTKLYISSDIWQSAVYHPPVDKFIIASENGKCTNSQDMFTWVTPLTILSTYSFVGLVSNGEFLAAYGNWRNRIFQSYDGSYWWSSYIDEGNFQGYRITWNDDKFVILDSYSATSTSNMAHSGDWTTINYADFMTDWDDSLVDVRYYDGMFYILTTIGNIYKYDGTAPSWTFVDVTELPAEWTRVVPQRVYGERLDYSEFLVCGKKGFCMYIDTNYSASPALTSEVHNWITGMNCKLFDSYDYRRWVMLSDDGTVAVAIPTEEDDVGTFTLFHTYTDFPCVDCSTNYDMDTPVNLIVSSNGKCLWFNGEFSDSPQVFTNKTPIKVQFDGRFYVLTSDGFIIPCTDDMSWGTPIDTQCPNVIDFVAFDGKLAVLGEGNVITICDTNENTWTVPITVSLPSGSVWDGITYWDKHIVLYSTSGYIALSMTGEYWREFLYPDSSVNFMNAIGVTNPYQANQGGEAPV